MLQPEGMVQHAVRGHPDSAAAQFFQAPALNDLAQK